MRCQLNVKGAVVSSDTYICDPHLGSVQQVPAIDLLRRCLHRHNITPCRVLTHSQPTNSLTRDQPGEVLLLLLVVAVQHQLVDTQLAVSGIAQPDTPTGPAELFHDHAVSLVPHSEAAILLARCDAEEASLAELLPHVVGERILAVCLGSNLFWDLSSRKFLHALAQLV